MENLENFFAYLTNLEERLSTLENNALSSITPDVEQDNNEDNEEQDKEEQDKEEQDKEESTLDKLFDDYQ